MEKSPKPDLLTRISRALRLFFCSDIKSLSRNVSILDSRHGDMKEELKEQRKHIDALRALIEKIGEEDSRPRPTNKRFR